MQREIERLEEERIQLKTENRKLARQIGGKVWFYCSCMYYDYNPYKTICNKEMFEPNFTIVFLQYLHRQQTLVWMLMIYVQCKNTEMHYEKGGEILQIRVGAIK